MIKKVEVEIELFAPIIFNEHRKHLVEVFNRMLKDLQESEITIELDNREINIKYSLKSFDGDNKPIRGYGKIVLEYQVELNQLWKKQKVYDNKGNLKNQTKEEYEMNKIFNLRTETEKFVMDFCFAINLAYPRYV